MLKNPLEAETLVGAKKTFDPLLFGEQQSLERAVILESLANFREKVNTTGFVDFLARKYWKRDRLRPDNGRFTLSQPFERAGRQRIEDKSNFGLFFTDGDFGFALCSEEESQQRLGLCVVSFSLGRDLPRHNPRAMLLNIPWDLLVIHQIQGPTSEATFAREREEALPILGKFRWEKVLVLLMMEWAKENKYSLGILPAEENNYVAFGKISLEKAKMRYDAVAKRLGFRKDPLSGIFIL